MSPKTFQETQRFNQIWLWILLLLISFAMLRHPLRAIYYWIISGGSVSIELPTSLSGIFWGASSILFVIVFISLFLFSKMRTYIDQHGINVKFGGFMKNQRIINWDEVKEVFIREYNAMDDYCGWGIKEGPKGKALIVKGNKGLQLFLKSGEKLLIGTQKHKAMQSYLEKYVFDQFDQVIE